MDKRSTVLNLFHEIDFQNSLIAYWQRKDSCRQFVGVLKTPLFIDKPLLEKLSPGDAQLTTRLCQYVDQKCTSDDAADLEYIEAVLRIHVARLQKIISFFPDKIPQ